LNAFCLNQDAQDERMRRIKDDGILAILKMLTIPIQTIAKMILREYDNFRNCSRKKIS